MPEPLKPMDVYATHRVPLEVAIYCRGHKFTPMAVALTRALNAETDAENHLKLAERVFNEARDHRLKRVEEAEAKMKADPHV